MCAPREMNTILVLIFSKNKTKHAAGSEAERMLSIKNKTCSTPSKTVR
jgi:hypothetical protein